jgi:TfoX/Sxy family transcriptional regulator of competence genes
LGNQAGLTEKKMFGGVAFMLHGNMAVGISGSDLMVRVGAERHSWALAQDGVRPFDMTGRPMAGWVLVTAEAIDTEENLQAWVAQGVSFANSLPAK